MLPPKINSNKNAANEIFVCGISYCVFPVLSPARGTVDGPGAGDTGEAG